MKLVRRPYRYSCIAKNRTEGRGPYPDTSAGDAAAEMLMRHFRERGIPVVVSSPVDGGERDAPDIVLRQDGQEIRWFWRNGWWEQETTRLTSPVRMLH